MQPPDWLRNPAYTGTRRCWPCAVVNAVVVALASAAFAVADFPAAAVAVAGLGLIAIWLRGYVVPYTPRFAPRLVDAIPGADRVFRHASAPSVPGSLADTPTGGSDGIDGAEAGEDVLERLVEAGVVVPDGAALSLDEAFAELFQDAMRDRRDASIEDLADAIEAALANTEAGGVASVRVESGARGPYVVVSWGDPGSLDDAWLTHPVAIAELAALEALGAFAEGDRGDHATTATLDDETRLQAAAPIRLFLEVCPACGAAVEETTTVDCCGGPAGAGADPDRVLACTECDSRLFTLPE